MKSTDLHFLGRSKAGIVRLFARRLRVLYKAWPEPKGGNVLSTTYGWKNSGAFRRLSPTESGDSLGTPIYREGKRKTLFLITAIGKAKQKRFSRSLRSGRQNKNVFPDHCNREDKTKTFFPIIAIGKTKGKRFSQSSRSGRQTTFPGSRRE
jgi:hypothetical protein